MLKNEPIKKYIPGYYRFTHTKSNTSSIGRKGIITTFKIERELLDKIDDLIDKKYIFSRSMFVQIALIHFLMYDNKKVTNSNLREKSKHKKISMSLTIPYSLYKKIYKSKNRSYLIREATKRLLRDFESNLI
ncbi:MAG: hypothetical protein HeimC3_44380 [Candidatus Heimdallarchaeota archaeon LC_3]|nr:MAG: hypothetical protein HeimC3_44380 [Candidatus Heimdallarchaeota archaeon LC_3]